MYQGLWAIKINDGGFGRNSGFKDCRGCPVTEVARGTEREGVLDGEEELTKG